MIDIGTILSSQRSLFQSGVTHPTSFRQDKLLKLCRAIAQSEGAIIKALRTDLGKSAHEAFATEIGLVTSEIRKIHARLPAWLKPRRVSSPKFLFPAKSYIYHEPLGQVLIIGPWNYPFQLMVSPLVASIAAGNTTTLKPSEHASSTADVLQKLIQETFSPDYVAIFLGDANTSQALLKERFDHIFFTGGTTTARHVMQAAAKTLTPVTLELGGKSPCIVDRDIDLDVTAKRIAWGKFLNAGQTCVAPDYLLVHETIKDRLIERLVFFIEQFFGKDPEKSDSYGRIINQDHFARLISLVSQQSIIYGGSSNPGSRFISPTLVTPTSMTAAIMQEEIFGPLLPIVPYSEFDSALDFIGNRPKPLACYLFSNNKDQQAKFLTQLHFGGGCINDIAIHLTNLNLPFGGVGLSGMGAYHGKTGVLQLSHQKSVVKKGFKFDIALRYPPYNDRKLKFLRRVFRFS